MSAKPDSIRSILYALFANLSIDIAKALAAFWTGSGAMMAESINRVEREFRQVFPMAQWLFFEPDNMDE